jgi:hypothetical protein
MKTNWRHVSGTAGEYGLTLSNFKKEHHMNDGYVEPGDEADQRITWKAEIKKLCGFKLDTQVELMAVAEKPGDIGMRSSEFLLRTLLINYIPHVSVRNHVRDQFEIHGPESMNFIGAMRVFDIEQFSDIAQSFFADFLRIHFFTPETSPGAVHSTDPKVIRATLSLDADRETFHGNKLYQFNFCSFDKTVTIELCKGYNVIYKFTRRLDTTWSNELDTTEGPKHFFCINEVLCMIVRVWHVLKSDPIFFKTGSYKALVKKEDLQKVSNAAMATKSHWIEEIEILENASILPYAITIAHTGFLEAHTPHFGPPAIGGPAATGGAANAAATGDTV